MLKSLFLLPLFASVGGVVPLDSPDATAMPSASPSHQLQRKSVSFLSEDSLLVEKLLRQPNLKSPLDFARQLKGKPYVAFTLEGNEPERLVVNLRGLDCATLVETATALAVTKRSGKSRFSDYCAALENLRYFNGKVDGYLSRLHYLSFWMAEQTRRGVAREVTVAPSLMSPLQVRLNYMSTHPTHYAALKQHPEWVSRIAALERKYSGEVGSYIPKRNLGASRAELGAIRDGDVIAIVTQKAGLDYSHQGLAVWGRDGKLHMLHASSDYQRVIEDSRTLQDYLNRIPHTLGIRVFRVLGAQ